MLRHTWCCYALLGLLISHVILASPIADRPTQLIDISELNPTYEEGEIIDENTREKRKIGLIKIGATSALIGLLFGGISKLGRISVPAKTTVAPGSTTTDDTPDFDRNRVSLDIPSELFGSSFRSVTTVSKLVGDVILGTAQRTERLVEAMKPFLGKFFLTKGLNVSTSLSSGADANKIR